LAHYANTDIRIKLADFRTAVFPGSVGIYGLFDIGRVWFEDQNGQDPTAPTGKSELWHKGYGGGAYIIPMKAFLVTFDLSKSSFDDGLVKYFRFGFLF